MIKINTQLLNSVCCMAFVLFAQVRAQNNQGLEGVQGKKYGLEQLQKYAIAHSFELKSQWHKVKAADQEIHLVYISALPSLKFSSRYDDYIENAKILESDQPDPYKYYNYSLDLNLTLFDGFKTWLSYAAAEAELNLQKSIYEKNRSELLVKITDLYFSAKISQVNLVAAKEKRGIAIEQERIAREKFEQKSATLFDLNSAELEILSTHEELERWNEQYAIAVGELMTTTGLVGIEIVEPFLQSAIPDIAIPFDTLIDIQSIPVVKVGHMQTKKLESELSVSRAGYAPTIGAYSQYGYKSLKEFGAGGDHDGYAVGLTINWDLFSGVIVSQKNEVKLEELRAQKAEYTNTFRIQRIKIESEKMSILRNKRMYEIAQQSLVVYKKRMALITEKYQLGLMTSTDYFQGKRSLLESETRLEETELQYLNKKYSYYIQYIAVSRDVSAESKSIEE